MIETQDYLGNVNKQGGIIRDIIRTIESRDIESGCGDGGELISELRMLWGSIAANADLIMNRVNVPVPGVGVPKAFEEVVESCNQKEWKGYDTIGSGRVGSTYTACSINNCNYVIKRQPIERVEANLRETSNYVEFSSFKNEVNALIDLQDWVHAPKIYAAWTCNGDGYIVMEKLYMCDLTNRYADVVNVIEDLFKRGRVHSDAHQANIMCRESGELVLIDYGRSRSFQNVEDVGFMSPHAWDTMSTESYTPTRVLEIELSNIRRDYGIEIPDDGDFRITRTDEYDDV
jgi:hypothetical protein